MKKVFFLVLTLLIFSSPLFAQYITVAEYVDEYKDMAISEMKRMGVPAAITLAQGILETQNGNSDLVKKSNNHFGIKCKSTWTAEGVSHDDDAPGECFRLYKDAEESYRDHSNFLRGSDRYASLFKLDPRDYKAWARGLRKAGYATNPRYPDILIKNIEENNLQQYTLEGADEVPIFDGSKYTDDKEDQSTQELFNPASEVASTQDANSSQSLKVSINGSRAINATKGTSLLAIATVHNINLAKLLEINDLNKDGLLEKDQIIFLDKKHTEGERDYYISQENETLYDVSQKNGVQLISICDFNQLSPNDRIYAGTKILLRRPDEKMAISNNAGENNIAKIHEVQPKEGLYSIAKRYGISVNQLREWNSLQNDNLKIGQQLIISK